MAKWNGRAYLAAGIVSLVAVAGVGVGVAAWTVGNNRVMPASVDGISVNVDSPSGLFIDILEAQVTDGTLVFGTIQDDDGWVTATENTEDLEISFSFRMEIPEGAPIAMGTAISVTPTIDERLLTAISDGYITLPVQEQTAFEVVYFDAQNQPHVVPEYASEEGSIYVTMDKNLKVDITLTAGWGSKFGGMNPTKDQDYQGIEGALSDQTSIYEAIIHLQELNGAGISFLIGSGYYQVA